MDLQYQEPFPRIEARPYQLALNEYGFYWLLLKWGTEEWGVGSGMMIKTLLHDLPIPHSPFSIPPHSQPAAQFILLTFDRQAVARSQVGVLRPGPGRAVGDQSHRVDHQPHAMMPSSASDSRR